MILVYHGIGMSTQNNWGSIRTFRNSGALMNMYLDSFTQLILPVWRIRTVIDH